MRVKVVKLTKLIAVIFMMGVFSLGIGFGQREVYAQDALRGEVRDLKKKLQALEKKVSRQSSSADDSFLDLLKGVELSGHLSTSFNYNFDEPDNRTNNLRIFDTDANTFNFDLFQLIVEKEAPEGGVGFRVDLDYGDIAEGIGSSGLGTVDDEFDLQQAYISLNAPLGIENLTLTLGKFVTLLGYEVIESVNNLNTSRSFLFGYAIPFTHTGILAGYTLNDYLDFNFGIVNGWDNVKDNNDAKTILGRVGITPFEGLSIGITGIYGSEQENKNGNKRKVIDVVAIWEATDQLTLGLNYDYGYEEYGVSATQSAAWLGLAGYTHYQWTDKWGSAARLEFFDDEDGARTGTAQDLWEITLTNDYKLYDDLLLRLEYRHDDSNKNSFTENAKAVDTQNTVSMELIYTF